MTPNQVEEVRILPRLLNGRVVKLVESSSPKRGMSVQVRPGPLMSKQTQVTSLIEINNPLKQGRLVSGFFPSLREVKEEIGKKKNVKILYGETYDLGGLTVDSLKYYFYLELVKRELEKMGIKVEVYVNIADVATVTNKGVKEKAKLKREGKRRLRLIQELNRVYGMNLQPFLMSQMMREPRTIEIMKRVKKIIKESKEIKKSLEKTVLKNKLKQEYASGFRYAAEEIALSIQFAVKVGPPREVHYDQVTFVVAEKLKADKVLGIYLSPSYPLGKDFSYFLSNPEVEEYGLTPYKAGSNKLNDFRVVLGKTSLKQVERLVNQSFVSEDQDLPNPVLDLVLITEMARELLNKDEVLLNKDLRKAALKGFKEYIYKSLRSDV